MFRSGKPSDDNDSDDGMKEKSQKTAQQQRRRQSDHNADNWTHLPRRNAYYNNNPSKTELKTVDDHLHRKVSEKNNDPKYVRDAKADTITVGLSNGDLIVSGNVKERRDLGSTNPESSTRVENQKAKDKMGSNLKERRAFSSTNPESSTRVENQKAKDKMGCNLKERRGLSGTYPENSTRVDKARDNASKHAKMKTLAYCEKNGAELQSIGINKEACRDCHKNLSDHSVAIMPEEEGTKKVTNWRKVDKDDVDVVRGSDRKREINVGFRRYDNNIPRSTKAFKETVKNNVIRSLKPCSSVDVISGAVQLANTIKEGNVEPYADVGALNATAGSVSNNLGGETVYARASVADVRAGFGDVASIGASNLSAGVHAEYGWTNSVGVNASVGRVDGNIGPVPVQVGAGLNFDAYASVGVNGVSASVLGYGIDIGPKIGIRTPFFDINTTLF